MARPRNNRRQLDIFNFSFLDCLACVIGLLIFILTIVVISGGRSVSTQNAGRLAAADHQVLDAQIAARLAADRRQQAEGLLSQRAQEIADPQAHANALRAQIRVLYEEQGRLDSASGHADVRLDAIQTELRDLGNPSVDPQLAAAQMELRRLDQETAELNQKTAGAEKKAAAETRRVSYYRLSRG
jgi:chromosome segregation ATPase